MPTYVTLINWTDQGVKDFADTVDRAAKADEAMGALGASFKDIYRTLGSLRHRDVLEAPDDESATAALLAVAAPHHHASRLRP